MLCKLNFNKLFFYFNIYFGCITGIVQDLFPAQGSLLVDLKNHVWGSND